MINKNTTLKQVLKLAKPCNCNFCQHGCNVGSGFLVEDDIKEISLFLKISEEKLKREYLEKVELFNKKLLRPKLIRKDKPYGKCIFFNEGKCTIHPVKPLQCKTSIGCKMYGEDLNAWFRLNHIVDVNDPESVRQYSLYLKNNGKVIEGGQLKDLIPDEKKLKKILSYEILR